MKTIIKLAIVAVAVAWSLASCTFTIDRNGQITAQPIDLEPVIVIPAK